MSRLRAWWAGFGWNRRDAVMYSIAVVGLVSAIVATATGWGWSYIITWSAVGASAAIGIWYGVRIAVLLTERHRRRRGARRRLARDREREERRRRVQQRELSTTGLAGFCVHGVGMLDQCDGCCPPRTVKETR